MIEFAVFVLATVGYLALWCTSLEILSNVRTMATKLECLVADVRYLVDANENDTDSVNDDGNESVDSESVDNSRVGLISTRRGCAA